MSMSSGGLLRFRLVQENIWMLQLHPRRNATNDPVLNALRSAMLWVVQELGHLCGPAQTLDKFAVAGHFMALLVCLPGIKHSV